MFAQMAHICSLTLTANYRAGLPNEEYIPVGDVTFKVTIIHYFDHETVTCQLGFATSKSILLNKSPFLPIKKYFLNHLTPSLSPNYSINYLHHFINPKQPLWDGLCL